MEEIWKAIPRFEGKYEVSNMGRIKSLPVSVIRSDNKPYTQNEKILKLGMNGKGYPCVRLCVNRVKTNIVVHRFVAICFIPNPDKKREVNHIDGKKDNNRVGNLEWCTPSENSFHAVKNGLRVAAKGEKHHNSTLKNIDVLNIKRLLASGFTQTDIAREMNISQSTISCIKRKVMWKHL